MRQSWSAGVHQVPLPLSPAPQHTADSRSCVKSHMSSAPTIVTCTAAHSMQQTSPCQIYTSFAHPHALQTWGIKCCAQAMMGHDCNGSSSSCTCQPDLHPCRPRQWLGPMWWPDSGILAAEPSPCQVMVMTNGEPFVGRVTKSPQDAPLLPL